MALVSAASARLRFVLCVVFAFVAALLFTTTTAFAQNDLEAPEARVKAAFLFKFGSYVEWPPGTFASSDAPFVIGVMDADALASELTAIVAGHSMGGREVVVHRLHDGDSTAGLHLVFVGKADGANLAGILAPVKGHAILVVTESKGALDLGSMINFVLVDGKVRFDASLQAAAAANLKISSRLLAVARNVRGAP